MSSKNPYRDRKRPPPFRAGDLVTPCQRSRSYPKWKHGEFRKVEQVVWDETNDPYGHWVLLIHNPMKANQYGFLNQCSKYNPANFTKESSMPLHPENAYDTLTQELFQTSHLIVKLSNNSEETFLELASDFISTERSLDHIRKVGKEGDVFYILKAVKRIEILPPTPPLKIVDLK